MKDLLKQMFYNFKETPKFPSDLLVENLICIEKIKEVDKRARAAWDEDPNTQGRHDYSGPIIQITREWHGLWTPRKENIQDIV